MLCHHASSQHLWELTDSQKYNKDSCYFAHSSSEPGDGVNVPSSGPRWQIREMRLHTCSVFIMGKPQRQGYGQDQRCSSLRFENIHISTSCPSPPPTLASLPVGPLGQEMTLRSRGVLLSPQSITRFQVVIPFRHSSLERPFLRLRNCLPWRHLDMQM